VIESGSSLVALFVYIPVAMLTGRAILRRAGYDSSTAILGAMPGALTVITAAGEDVGADESLPAFHSVRIVFVVVVLTLTVPVFLISPPAAAAATAASHLDLWPVLTLAACGVIALLGMRFLPFAGARVVWPLVIAALVTSFFADTQMPTPIFIAAQVLFGASVGQRCSVSGGAHFRRAVAVGLVMTVTLLAISVVLAAVMTRVGAANVSFLTWLLALAPGGAYEISLLAGAVGADVDWVAFHHVLRVVLLSVAVPLLVREQKGARHRTFELGEAWKAPLTAPKL
jgi:membrane AbrB-like protein